MQTSIWSQISEAGFLPRRKWKGSMEVLWRIQDFNAGLCFWGCREIKTGMWWVHGFSIPGSVPKTCGCGTGGHYLWGTWVDGWIWSWGSFPTSRTLGFHEIKALVSVPRLAMLLWLPAHLGPFSWLPNISCIFFQNNSKLALWGGVPWVAVGQGWTFVSPFPFLGGRKSLKSLIEPQISPRTTLRLRGAGIHTYKSQSGFSNSFHAFNPEKHIFVKSICSSSFFPF